MKVHGLRTLGALHALTLGLGGCFAASAPGAGEDARGLDAGAALDAGDGATGGDGAILDEGAPRTFVFEGVVQTEDGVALEGAHVALDPAEIARRETRTDAAGAFRIEVPTPRLDVFDVVIALEGYTINAFDGFSAADVAELIAAPVVLDAFAAPRPGTLRVDINATGVPDGGQWCVSAALRGIECRASDETFGGGFSVPDDAMKPGYFYAFAFGPDEELFDFVRGEWEEGGDLRGTAVFDGVFEDVPETTAWTVALPEDTESPFRTEDFDDDRFAGRWPTWLAVAEPVPPPFGALYRSVMTDLVVEETQVTFRLQVFPGPAEPVWFMNGVASRAEGGPVDVFSNRFFSAPPSPPALTFLDVPRVIAGSRWDEAFSWTAPAADVDHYELRLGAGRGQAVAISVLAKGTSATVPPLPSSYDRSVSFPVRGASGVAWSIATRGSLPRDGLFGADGEIAQGPVRPIRW